MGTGRELAFFITGHQDWFISESSVYRILKNRGLIAFTGVTLAGISSYARY